MGYVEEQRAVHILQRVLLRWLEDGTIPSPEQLQVAYEAEQKIHGIGTRSALRSLSFPERYSESSASLFNGVIDAIEEDISVLLKSLVQVDELNIRSLGDWSARAKSLEARLAKLRGRVDSLFLLNSDAAGYISFVEDGFFSLENVSSDTTANVDTHTGEVTLNVNKALAEGAARGTQVDIRGGNITIGLIEGGNTRYVTKVGGAGAKNLLNDANSAWQMETNAKPPQEFKTSSTSGKPLIAEVKIRLPKVVELSKVLMITSDATAGTDSVIASQYSLDGYTWEVLPSDSAVMSGSGNFIWRFPKTEMAWIKFVISKASPDTSTGEGSVYDFGVQQIKVFSEEYYIDDEGVLLYSEVLSPTLGGNPVSFGRAALEVCEEVPDESSIQFFMRAYDGSSYTNWVPVSPINRDSEGVASVVDFTAPAEYSSSEITTTFDSASDSESLNILRASGSSTMSYRFEGPNDTVANFYIEATLDALSDLVLLRNLGYEEAKYPTVDTSLLVGEVECGWGLDGDSIYYCDFLVEHPDGLELNFGESQAVIDGRSKSGYIVVPPGWHTFRTTRPNWGPLDSSLSTSEPTTEAELKAIDPLYPYNHKYMIEGYTYPESFSGKKTYLGTDLYCQTRATRIGRYDFASVVGFDPSIYAMDVLEGPQAVILLKFDSSYSNHQNERVRLLYTIRSESYEGVQLKALLKSDDTQRTPVLSYYRIRVK